MAVLTIAGGQQLPITGSRGLLSTSLQTIYTVPFSNSGSAYAAIENITFTNTVDDDPFTVTLYQNSRNSKTPTVVWSYESVQAKTFVDGDIKRLIYGDSILAICDKTTVQYVVNGYYEVTNPINTNPAVAS